MPKLHISVSSRTLSCGSAKLAGRSIGLFRFVAYLAWMQEQHGQVWVGLGELSRALGVLHGRQLQRYMDSLSEAGLAVVDCGSKTRGPYRLASAVAPAIFDVTLEQLAEFLHLPASIATPPTQDSETALLADNGDFSAALRALVRADASYYGGTLAGSADGAYELLQPLVNAGPADLRAVALFKQAMVCQRLGRDTDLAALLASAEAMVAEQQSAQHAQLLARLRLIHAKSLLDEGHRLAAAAILGKVRPRDCADGFVLGRYYNLRGLIAFHELRHEHRQTARQAHNKMNEEPPLPLLARIAADYRQALAAQITCSDYQGLQATCFNFGNALLFSYREFPLDESSRWLDAGIGWLAHCDAICRQFGVGSDSRWNRIVLIDLALLPGTAFAQVQRALAELSIGYDDLPQMIAETLAETRRIGNHLEEAEVLRQMVQLELQQGRRRKAEGHARQAIALLLTLQRQDKVRQVRALLKAG